MKSIGSRRFGVVGVTLCVLALSRVAYGQSDGWADNGSNGLFLVEPFFLNVGIGTTAPAYNLHVVEGSSVDGTRAIYGLVNAASGVTNGVYGQSTSTAGRGVIGFASATTGTNFGVVGLSASTSGRGVWGLSQATSGSAFGVYGQCNSTSGIATFGWAVATSGVTDGVHGQNDSTTNSAAGVFGHARGTSGATSGVYGDSDSSTGTGVFGIGASFGVFSNGTLGASGTKTFYIDHPADPENKYLVHYSTESPEVLNSYSGKVWLDGLGAAVVELPAYFARVNKDPRYTLTPVGAPMPLLHVAQEIGEAALSNGARAEPGEAVELCSFRIAGGAPGGKVSWRIEAVRNDRWVQTRGAPVEVEKQGSARGTYLQPELFGQAKEMGTYFRPAPEAPLTTLSPRS